MFDVSYLNLLQIKVSTSILPDFNLLSRNKEAGLLVKDRTEDTEPIFFACSTNTFAQIEVSSRNKLIFPTLKFHNFLSCIQTYYI